jgi:endonuclease YncB( thermonuclease family)
MKRQSDVRWATAVAMASLLASVQAHAQPEADLHRGDTIAGTATAIHDGDTLVLGGYRVRLANIDAPEVAPPPGVKRTAANRNGQPFGEEAREILDAFLVADGYQATAEVRDVDRYGRAVAVLNTQSLSDAGISVNAAMVRMGAAWVYDAYNDDSSLVALQDWAREGRDGLWALPAEQRQEPWAWRACQRKPTASCRRAGP